MNLIINVSSFNLDRYGYIWSGSSVSEQRNQGLPCAKGPTNCSGDSPEANRTCQERERDPGSSILSFHC